MNRLLRTFLVAAVIGCSLLSPGSQSAQADDYWANHWNWYDNTYRPYYYRNYYSAPAYGNYYGPGVYGGYGYYGPSYYNPYGYGYSPYSTYYGTPGVGYGRFYGGGSALNVGPLSFGWR